jgi:hypothetical protein
MAVVATSAGVCASGPQPPSSFCAAISHLSGRSTSGSVRARSGSAPAAPGSSASSAAHKTIRFRFMLASVTEATHTARETICQRRRRAASTSRCASLRFWSWRLSYCFLPLQTPSSTLMRPFLR